MWKMKCFLDFRKEEKWLEEMGRKGYRLRKSNSGFYQFDYSNIPGEFNIKIDYRYFSKYPDFLSYCVLFEDSGWQHIAGSKNSGTQYFVKSRPDAGDDIFTDNYSRAGRYKRLSYLWMSLAIAYIPIACTFITTGILEAHSIFNWKTLYLTPGLWDMKGARFLRAFLFETPFALMRGFGWTLFLLLVAFYAYYAIKSYLLYRREVKQI